jgi:hypothetical protein
VNKLYTSFYDCINDLETVLGISSLDDMEKFGIKFAKENGFSMVAEYFEENVKKFRWHMKKEWEDVIDADSNSCI